MGPNHLIIVRPSLGVPKAGTYTRNYSVVLVYYQRPSGKRVLQQMLLFVRKSSLGSRNRANEAVRISGITWESREPKWAGQLRQMVAAIPREIRDITTLAFPGCRGTSEACFYIGMVAITVAAFLVCGALEEGLHAFEKEAANKVSSAIAGTEARRHEERTTPAYAGSFSCVHPVVNPCTAA